MAKIEKSSLSLVSTSAHLRITPRLLHRRARLLSSLDFGRWPCFRPSHPFDYNSNVGVIHAFMQTRSCLKSRIFKLFLPCLHETSKTDNRNERRCNLPKHKTELPGQITGRRILWALDIATELLEVDRSIQYSYPRRSCYELIEVSTCAIAVSGIASEDRPDT